MGKSSLNVALLGNPNAGKSSVFNHLTGLQQKTGNFPGVTVDKKIGFCQLSNTISAKIIDLPGTYSIYPRSKDEQVVFDILNNKKAEEYPDVLLVIVDASNLRRNLLFFTQLRDLGLPTILGLNMMDIANKRGLVINVPLLEKELGVKVVEINGRSAVGLHELKECIASQHTVSATKIVNLAGLDENVVKKIKSILSIDSDYTALQLAHYYKTSSILDKTQKQLIEKVCEEEHFNRPASQAQETITRYQEIGRVYDLCVKEARKDNSNTVTARLDKILTHKIWGYAIFITILFLIFQAVFAWTTYPMDLIDQGIAILNAWLQTHLPKGVFTNLLTEGLISGLGGVLIFIPQIAVLFSFIAILEESGYMARVMYIMDKLMRPFGLNGKSVVPLVSSVACAVPAIMAARSIDNWKERMITIFVAPLVSCSARIPVFTILIALAVPADYIFGFINIQGLVLMALYVLGFAAAMISALAMKLLIRSTERSYFIMELPSYKVPRWKNIAYTIFEKVKTFVQEAGKVIVALSVILWVLASYGPGDAMLKAEKEAKEIGKRNNLSEKEIENNFAAKKLEASYAGHFGHFIEPAIRPLGFDWKIGIALITSFAAREVFVGTMSTIYSIGATPDEESTIVNRMRSEINPETGKPMYTLALSSSLIIFYLFAMQCMSTLAVTKRETKSWKWPLLQLVYMTGLAYLASFVVYTLLG